MASPINIRNFLSAVRETGYRSPAHALAELVDNSIQAEASHIEVIYRQDRSGDAELVVADNGIGMDSSEMQQALQFGGSSRFGDRTGLGRFGMGLPMSGASLARRIEVFSWRDSDVYKTHLDLGARVERIPVPKLQKRLPFEPKTNSGTTVILRKCDRVPDFLKEPNLQTLILELRRIFRYFLGNGISITVNDQRLLPFDPLHLSTVIENASAFRYGPLLTYQIRTQSGTWPIEAQFTRLPIAKWRGLSNLEKQRCGISKGAGISVVRANREIAYGWYFMGTKRRENYDDWWRCEVKFHPELDDLFRVTHTKQQIAPCAELDSALTTDIESIGRALNGIVRTEFQELGAKTQSPAERDASGQDKYLPPLLQTSPSSNQVSVRNANYSFTVEEKVGDNAFYSCNLKEGAISVKLNGRHPFATEFKVAGKRPGERYGIEALLLAAARVELSADNDRARWWFRCFRKQWSDVLATFLGGKS